MCAQDSRRGSSTLAEQLGAQLERERRARESGYYRSYLEQYERVKDGQDQDFASLPDFFGFLRQIIAQAGKNDREMRLTTELFLADHASETEPPSPPPEPETIPSPPESSETKPLSSEEVWERWLAEEKEWTPEKGKKFIQEHYPEGLAVRGRGDLDKETKRVMVLPQPNLDVSASILFLEKVIGLDEEYLQKTKYVLPGQYLPGALNIDTSWGVWGAAGRLDDRAEAFDHHAPDAPRRSSACRLLYDLTLGYDEVHKEIYETRANRAFSNPEDRIAWENLVLFVTAVDSVTLPKGISWEQVWDSFETNLFAICLVHSRRTAGRVKELLEFFRTHSWKDAFRPLDPKAITDVLGTAGYGKKKAKDQRAIFYTDQQALIKQQAKEFLNTARGSTVFSPVYGKILVVFNEQMPGGHLAAFGNGYDALLLWQPAKNSFMLNVRPEGPAVPYALHEKLGEKQTVWVRGGMFFQPDWRSTESGLKRLSFSLTNLLKELQIDPATLSSGFKRKIQEAEKGWAE